MKQSTALKVAFLFSLIGFLFSGYLSITKLLGTKCIIAEGCTYFLGYPTCVYGFIMYTILLVATADLLFLKPKEKDFENVVKIVLLVSIIGLIFAGYFNIVEVPLIGSTQYTLFFPTCFYGFFMYLIIFLATYFGLYRKKK